LIYIKLSMCKTAKTTVTVSASFQPQFNWRECVMLEALQEMANANARCKCLLWLATWACADRMGGCKS